MAKAICLACQKSSKAFLLSLIFVVGFVGGAWAQPADSGALTPDMAGELSKPQHALAMFDDVKYKDGFTHFDYTNPQAPKGGTLRMAIVGSFDSLNPFIVRGISGAGTSFIYESLMEKSADEPSSAYGLLAQSVRTPPNRAWVEFVLRPEAKWHDGVAITADDVIWSYQTLVKQGAPFFRSYYAHVAKVDKIDKRTVRFIFDKPGNREAPLIMGDLPVLPKHFWTDGKHEFSKTSLDVPLGSGPYRLVKVDGGRKLVYEREKNWWGRNLPINKGRYNFDTITYDYYRDNTVAQQALLAGAYDVRLENVAKNWAQTYDQHPNIKNGNYVKWEIKHGMPTGMQAFVYNTRRPIFADIKLREALAYAFDFEWSNKQLAFGSYTRSNSFFSNSELAARQLPSARELELLEPFRTQLPPQVFDAVYNPPKTDGSGDMRSNLRTAMTLLKEAGYVQKNGVLFSPQGQPVKFEILLNTSMFSRWILPFIANLKRLGIEANLREVDEAQYQNRMNDFDFDMTIDVFGQGINPGNEQRNYWGSQMANEPGSANKMGIASPVVDKLIDHIVQAQSRESLVAATRALDRVLLWQHFVIPQWYSGTFRLIYNAKLGHPAKTPPFGLPIEDTWWVKE